MRRKYFQFPWRTRTEIRNDVDSELRFHLDARADELIAAGTSPDDARAQARREFGDMNDARAYINRLDQQTESARRRKDYVGDLVQDVVYAVRQLRAARAYALTAIITLALGIGANTAIFSVVNGVLLRPLPFPQPQQLYKVWSANRAAGNLRSPVSPLDVDDWRAQRRNVADIGAYFFIPGGSGIDLTGNFDPQRLSSVFVTPGFFTTLDVHAVAGRLPREDEMVRGGPDRVAVLSHRFWLRQFSASRGVMDSMITLAGESYRVIGVLPPRVTFPSESAELYLPYSTIPDNAIPRLRQVRVLDVIARARAGVSQAQVDVEMNAITKRLAAAYPENAARDAATVAPLHDALTGSVSKSLWVLLGAVGCVLLIACVNIASLQLARASARGPEIAVRMALGAGRGRIVRQLITENIVLALAGGAAGLIVARVGLGALLRLSAGQLPLGTEVHLDAPVVAFAFGVSLMCGIACGLAPALLAARDMQYTLRAGGRGMAAASGRLRNVLVVAEVALALMLVVGGGLMAKSFVALMREDPGFKPDHVLALNFSLSTTRNADYRQAYTRILEGTRALPGVVAAGAIKNVPFRGTGERNGFRIAGMTVPAGEEPPSAMALHVSEGYFRAIGARMIEGREFTSADRADAPPVVVVNEAFARRWFPGQRATEQSILLGAQPVPIIGVVNDIRQVAMSEPAQPAVYIHNLQNGRVQTTLVVRTAGDPLSMADAVRRVIWSVDKLQPITSVFTLGDAVHDALARPRLITVVLGAFGALGLLLGAIGLYGVLSFLVSQRQREIGVRLALGALPSDVLRMVVKRGLALTAIGITVGLGGALLLGRYLSGVLYGVTPSDPATFVLVSATLIVVAVVASWVPARRAASVDPAITLRA